MNDENLGFTSGSIPSGVSVAGNIEYALAYQSTHTKTETILWFKNMVQNGGAWDYKQLDADTRPPGTTSIYENFGNYNYGAVGTALGMSQV